MLNPFAIDRHLSQCATDGGLFAVLAIDHRANLVEDMARARGRAVDAGEVVAFKRTVIRHLAGVSSALLTDPDYGFPGLIDSGVGGRFGLLAPLEVTDYTLHPSRRKTEFIEHWGVDAIKRSGCNGVKLLLYFHPDADNADAQTDLVDGIVARCRRQAVPFFLEPMAYSLDPDTPLGNDERAQVVIETARHFSPRGIDVLKVQFPYDASAGEATWRPALDALNAACTVPWALLSAGVTFDLFLRQTAAACRAGASGVIVGRAVWAEALSLEGKALDTFLHTTGRARMQALAATCALYGSPWYARRPRPVLEGVWYRPVPQRDGA